MDKETVIRDLQPLCAYLQEELKNELVQQGHTATTALLESIRVVVLRTAYGYAVEGWTKFYGRYVDTGRRPGGKKVPIDALIGWIKAKGIPLNGRKEIDLAFAIQTNIYKHGIPTDKDQDKRFWITKTIKNNEEKIAKDIETAVGDFLRIELHDIINEARKELN